MEKDKRVVRRISVAVALATPLALVVVVSLAWPASAAGPGQGVPAPSAAAPVADPAVEVVDGARTPERIPDETAYRLVFRLVAALVAKGDEQSARAYVSSLGLGRGCGECRNSGGAATDR